MNVIYPATGRQLCQNIMVLENMVLKIWCSKYSTQKYVVKKYVAQNIVPIIFG